MKFGVLFLLLLFQSIAWAFKIDPVLEEIDKNPYAFIRSSKDDLGTTTEAYRKVELLYGLAAAYNQTGNSPGAIENANAGLALARALSLPQMEALFYAVLGDCENAAGRSQSAAEYYQRALGLVNSLEHLAFKTVVEVHYASYLMFTANKTVDGLEYLTRALDYYRSNKAPIREANVRILLGSVHEKSYNYDLAEAEYLKANGLLNSGAHLYLSAVVNDSLAHLYLRKTNYPKSKEYIYNAVSIYESLGDTIGLAYSFSTLSKIALAEKQYPNVIQYAIKAKPILKQGGNEIDVAILSAREIIARASMGQSNLEYLLEDVQNILGDSDNSSDRAFYEYANAHVLLSRGKTRAAFDKLIDVRDLENQARTEDQNQLVSDLIIRYNSQQQEVENKQLLLEQHLRNVELDNIKTKERYMMIIVLVLIGLLTAVIVLYLRQASFRRKYQQLAITDTLTQAPNRRAIFEALERRVQRGNGWIAVADLDRFKSINDQYGHGVGDLVLTHFFHSISSIMHREDILGRSGGEEWIFVLNGDDQEVIQRKFDAFMATFKQHAIDGLPSDYPLSFSVGVVKITNNKDQTLLLREADAALYDAKNTGRGKTVFYELE